MHARGYEPDRPALGPETVDDGVGLVTQGETGEQSVVTGDLELRVEGSSPCGQDADGAGADAVDLG